MHPNAPNLVIAGVNKAGTTSLFSGLSRHPDVATSDVKETCFFLPLRYREAPRPIEEYYEHFQHAGQATVVMEATPGYFYGGEQIAPVLADLRSDLRVVIALREPVSRFISFFRFQKAMLKLPGELSVGRYVEDCLQLSSDDLARHRELNPWFGLEGGFYDRYLPAWVDALGDRLDIVFFDDLIADPDRVVASLGERFGLDRERWPLTSVTRENRTIAPRRRSLHRAALAVNRTFERQLRRHPSLKARARDLYRRANADRLNEDVPQTVLDALEETYAPWNTALARRLRTYELDAPDWVA